MKDEDGCPITDFRDEEKEDGFPLITGGNVGAGEQAEELCVSLGL